MKKIKNKVYLLALLPFFIMVLLFEILPLINIVIESFSKTGGGGFTLEHFTRIFSTRLYQQSIYNSLWISIFSAICGIIIAFLGAKAANSASTKIRNIFTSILNITSNFAGVPLAFAFMILLGNVGILTLIGKNYGIDLSKKRQLITSRLSNTIVAAGFASFSAYIDHIIKTSDKSAVDMMLNKLTTNYTYFLREG